MTEKEHSYLRFSLRYGSRFLFFQIFVISLAAISGLLRYPFVLCLRDVIDVTLRNAPIHEIIRLSIATLLLIVGIIVSTMLYEIYGTILYWKVVAHIWEDQINKIMRIPEHRGLSQGEYIARLQMSTNVANIATLPTSFGLAIEFFLIVYALYTISPILTLFLAILIPLTITLMWYLSYRASLEQQQAIRLYENVIKRFNNIIQGAPSFKYLGKTKYLIGRFRRTTKEYLSVYSRAVKRFIFADRIVTLIWLFAPILFIIIGAIFASQGLLTIPDVVSFSLNVGSTFSALQPLIRSIRTALESKPGAEKVMELMQIPEEKSGEMPAPKIEEIAFESITFRYPNSREYVLRDISTVIRRGEWIAVVGTTGVGKTTFAKLIVRGVNPDKGRVLINNIDVRDINIESLRSNIIYISSKEYFFEGTVRENLCLDDEIPDEEIWSALRYCQVDFIESLDDKIGEGGLNSSEGQRQRLALARALLRKPQVLILDEALSGVDSETEGKIIDSLRKLGVTLIIVSHRLSTILSADRVILLDSGKIMAEGKHEELLRGCSRYKELIERQLIGSDNI